jgi:hypothetical protein
MLQFLAWLGHFEHRVAELFVGELAVDFPTVGSIELDGRSIGFDHPQAKNAVSATAYLTLSVHRSRLRIPCRR